MVRNKKKTILMKMSNKLLNVFNNYNKRAQIQLRKRNIKVK